MARWGAVLAVVAIGLTAASAQAQSIPLPRDLQQRSAGPSAPAAASRPQQSVGTTPTRPGQPAALDANQRSLVDRVSMYLSSISTMTGKFVQVGPDGTRQTGEFFMQKPGKVRFEYDAPSPIDIVSDGSSVVVRDRKLATQDLYPLSQTPLRYLLADRIDLLRETKVTGVYADAVFASIVIEERQAVIGTSRLMMMFGAKDLQLKQWTITDPQGYDTTVAVYDLDTSRRIDPVVFRIDYTRYPNGFR